MAPQEELRTLTAEEGLEGCHKHRNPWYSVSPLPTYPFPALLPSLSLPISFSLSTSHLLLNIIPTVDFGIWSGLHLNSGRGISYNWIIESR